MLISMSDNRGRIVRKKRTPEEKPKENKEEKKPEKHKEEKRGKPFQ